MSTLQECYDALEKGHVVTLWDGSSLYRRPTGEYVYAPYQIDPLVAQTNLPHTCEDRESLFAFIVLRDAVIAASYELPYVDADSVPGEWVRLQDIIPAMEVHDES